MTIEDSRDQWRHWIFRDVASFIHEPDAARRARLLWLIDSYRYFHHQAGNAPSGHARNIVSSHSP